MTGMRGRVGRQTRYKTRYRMLGSRRWRGPRVSGRRRHPGRATTTPRWGDQPSRAPTRRGQPPIEQSTASTAVTPEEAQQWIPCISILWPRLSPPRAPGADCCACWPPSRWWGACSHWVIPRAWWVRPSGTVARARTARTARTAGAKTAKTANPARTETPTRARSAERSPKPRPAPAHAAWLRTPAARGSIVDRAGVNQPARRASRVIPPRATASSIRARWRTTVGIRDNSVSAMAAAPVAETVAGPAGSAS